MNLFIIFSIACITLFGLLAIYLFVSKKGVPSSNWLLGGFFLLWALDFLDAVAFVMGFYETFPRLALWIDSTSLLYGPLLFFYTKRILGGILKKNDLVHLLPFICLLFIIMATYHSLPLENKLEVLHSISTSNQPIGSFIGALLIYAHVFAYVFHAKGMVSKTVKNLNAFYSEYDINWLKDILNAVVVILVISLLATLFYYNPNVYFKIGLPLLALCMGLILIRIIVKALDHPFVVERVKFTSTAKNKLEQEEADMISEKVLSALEQNSIHFQPDLTLEQLSLSINENTRKVSMAINEVFKKSFFDLINGYRVEAAKKILKESQDDKLTILEVMYLVGYNSKSSFNTQFKNRTGLTPTEYRRLKT
ncbi:helix-turn-helix domain-containing protein [uncultured Allomuricauda sp.]|uniref:helix-turn-helix domain-containing protein n=1 Tax=Flagellimonas sp. W118 TaxID=3410791 RepID=UPI0026105632|nr:helix-turn-helix domain-containing protein [uncultured Allomuricauda sp.]